MVQLIITLGSGVQVVYQTDEHEAELHVQAIRAAWDPNSRSGLTDLVITSDDGITDWVRLADISAVRVQPAHLDEKGQADGSAG